MVGPGDDFVETLTSPIRSAKRLLDYATASTDPEYLRRKLKPKPKLPVPMDMSIEQRMESKRMPVRED